MTRVPSIISENLRKTFMIHYALSVFLPILIMIFIVNQYVVPHIHVAQLEQMKKVFLYGLGGATAIPLLSFFLMNNWIKLFEGLTDDLKSRSNQILSSDLTVNETNEISTIETIFDSFQQELKTKITELDNYSKQLIESNRKLSELSIRDELTGLYNRRHLDARLTEEIQRTKRYKCRSSLMMLDIDNFKRYNDTYGHPAGDKLLQTFSSLVRDSIRITDIPFRYGGDEFIILCPECDLASTVTVAQRLVDMVQSDSFLPSGNNGHGPITISCGVSDLKSNQPELLAEVDKHLYRAKTSGGNRVIF